MTLNRRLGTVALTGTALVLLTACAAPGTARSTAVAPAHLPVASPVPVASEVAATATAAASPITTPSPSPSEVPTPVAATASAAPPSAAAVEAAAQRPPHFDTPEAAMRYLVDAYNAHDIAAEMHVTTPDSRSALESEREWVQTFSFHSCTPNAGAGDYSCRFDMTSMVPGLAIPSASAANDAEGDGLGNTPAAMNEITVLVAPAARPGWYMYFNMGCGDG